MKFHFKENYEPYAVHTPLPIPHHWEGAVKSDIDRDVRLGIIEKVPEGTPVEWCARMVVQPKSDGKLRRTVDLQELKKATLRETHYTPTPFSIVSTTPPNTYKSVLDAWNGYHSLPLSKESRDATTFITKWGRYRYRRAPMGFHASGDAYTHRFDNITSHIDRVKRCVDDSLLWDVNIEDSFWHTHEYLKHCADNGIVFNTKKFKFAEKTCEFAGFEITPTGYKPPEPILNAIRDFPTPKTITDMQSWFGLINQVSYYFAQAETMAPFRELLSKKHKKLYWDATLDKLFNESKTKIISQIKEGVHAFEKDRVTCLSTDWSKAGIGYCLSQKHCSCTGAATPTCGDGHWHLILAGSRFTKPAESRYAPIEGEALGIVYGLQQCKAFVMGCPKLIVAVDHKPLTRILNDRPLETIQNPRLLRLKEKTLAYNYDIIHIAGKKNCGPDATSRYPTRSAAVHTRHAGEDDDETHKELSRCAAAFARSQSATLPASITWDEVNNAAMADDECTELRNVIENGFPKMRRQLPESLRYYWSMRKELYVIDNVSFKGRKMLIPKILRKRVLEGLHAAHQGVNGIQANAKERLFWPGLSADITQRRNQCKPCNENAPSQPEEPIIITPDPKIQ